MIAKTVMQCHEFVFRFLTTFCSYETILFLSIISFKTGYFLCVIALMWMLFFQNSHPVVSTLTMIELQLGSEKQRFVILFYSLGLVLAFNWELFVVNWNKYWAYWTLGD